jgi:hypothetical protein
MGNKDQRYCSVFLISLRTFVLITLLSRISAWIFLWRPGRALGVSLTYYDDIANK